jgi:hypothetical protein
VPGDEGSGIFVGRDAVRKVLDLAESDRLAGEKDDNSEIAIQRGARTVETQSKETRFAME